MTSDAGVSTPPGTAAADDGFAKAFESAVKSVDLSGAEFAPAAMEPEEPKPVETNEPEPATDAKPKARVAAKADKAPAPAVESADGPQAPANWDATRREAFGRLPPDARKIVLDIAKGVQGEATRVTTEAAEDRKFSQSVRSLITNDHRAQMRRAGMSDEQGLAHLIRLNDEFSRDPVAYVRMVIERTGIDPRQVFPEIAGGTPPAQGQQPAPGQADPHSQQIYGYLQSVQGQLDRYERERQQTTERTVNRSIERFAKEQDAEGNSRHPYFDRVQGKMAELLTTPTYQAIEDYGERLEAAYDAAVYLDPDVRNDLVTADLQRRMRAQRDADDLAKARKAKAPVKAPPATTGKVKPDTLADSIRQSMGMLGVS